MNGKRILVVEDETIVQLHLRSIVIELGYTLTGVATTGEEALALASAEPPDVALMDVRILGAIDGIETARELKERHGSAVVFVTAYADDRTVARIESVGAAGYVVKPFREAEVRVALRTALQGHETMRRLEDRARSLNNILECGSDAVIAIDLEGRVICWTPQARALTAWEESEALGRSVHDFVKLAAAGDDAAFRRTLSHSLAHAQPEQLTELRLETRDGQERLVRGETIPLLDARGVAEGLVLHLRDTRRRVNGATSAPIGAARSGSNDDTRAAKRMLVYSHDTFGLGHLRRCFNLTRAVLRRNPGISVLIATGSPVAHRFPLPPGADYVKLPAVKKVASEQYEARSLEMPDGDIHKLRTNLLLRTARDFEPDLLLVDHAPAGMLGEMLPTLEWLAEKTNCVNTIGLRDIIDAPEAVIETWRSQGIPEILDHLYDHVLVYGMREVFDPTTEYRFAPEIAAKTRFTGYVTDEDEAREARESFFSALPRPLVVVTIGGGDGGGETVIGNYLEMLRRYRSQVDFWTVVLTGPLIPAPLAKRFNEESRGLPVTLRDFVPSTRPYVRHADLVVCTAGYNTMTQVLAAAPRALVVPRILHREEQLIRVQRLAAMDMVDYLHPDTVTPERLFAEVRRQLSNSRAPLAEARARQTIRFDGAERVAGFCGEVCGLALADAGGTE